MSARLPLGILLTAAPALITLTVPFTMAVIGSTFQGSYAASLPVALLLPLLTAAAGLLLVRAERRPILRAPLALGAVSLGVALLGVVLIAVATLAPGGSSTGELLMNAAALGAMAVGYGSLATVMSAVLLAVLAVVDALGARPSRA